MATPLPENAAEFSVEELAAATGGRIVQEGASRVLGVATDTRAQLSGKAFVALRGDRFDAHDLLEDAVRAGAEALIVERETALAAAGVTVLCVPSTLSALGALARHHRRRWGRTVVAIGGSAGKTTTRSATSSVLGAVWPGRVHATSGNLNNLIGLPLTLLGVRPEHDVCVVEVGTNRLGEVAALVDVCEPNVAVLTLVDLEHSEGLGDLDSIEQEEGALLARLEAADTVVGNGDDERVRRQVERSSARHKLLYGTDAACNYRILERHPRGHEGARLVALRPEATTPVSFECPLLGLPGALSATAAWAVAESVTGQKLEGATLSAALAGAGEGGRLGHVELADGSLVLDDTYNANPASVRRSIETARELAELRGGRLWLVLGEMRELGSSSEVEHIKMGELAAASSASGLFVIGTLAEPAIAAASDGGLGSTFCADASDAVRPLVERIAPGDVVLVKASRGVRAERVVSGLVEALGRKA